MTPNQPSSDMSSADASAIEVAKRIRASNLWFAARAPITIAPQRGKPLPSKAVKRALQRCRIGTVGQNRDSHRRSLAPGGPRAIQAIALGRAGSLRGPGRIGFEGCAPRSPRPDCCRLQGATR